MSAGVISGNVFHVEHRKVTIDMPSISANTTEENTFTVSGLRTGDMVFVNKPSHDAGVVIGSCRVSAVDTLAIQMSNSTASPVDPSSEDYDLLIVRPE